MMMSHDQWSVTSTARNSQGSFHCVITKCCTFTSANDLKIVYMTIDNSKIVKSCIFDDV